ncbi:hypothetical protein [Streptomyces beihaiensis]|uniref:Lipoprotein n=1 Tax=Streptomyces beihaiensis TaxID=2984495 RepID=A0ABT3TP86_9ACTN|nr:hypothetical protein [Streptomyces beihaiensis]MCX3058839.1 hypothetical protein [Streptomyces beihaiensis]
MRGKQLAVLPVVVLLAAAGCGGAGKPTTATAPVVSPSKSVTVSDPDHPDSGKKTPGHLGPGAVKLPVAVDRIAELGVRYDCLGPGGVTVTSGTGMRAEVAGCDDSATYGASTKAKDLHGRRLADRVTVTVGKRTRWRMSVDITTKDGVKQTVHG